MVKHVVYVAPFFMEASLRFLQGALSLDGVRVSLISQDPVERLPAGLRQQLVGHWRVANGLDATQIAEGVKKLEKTLGEVSRVFGPLEQLQVPLAMVREMLGIEGLGVQAAQNFRDKAQMKTVLADAGVPCARHQLIADEAAAWRFVEKTGFPVVVKPPAGAGGKSTFRLDNKQDLQSFLHRNAPDPAKPALYEEFVAGKEYSFDSVIIGGRPVWYSISSYQPTPLEVMENAWIQWCVLLPKSLEGAEFAPIVDAAFSGLNALGLQTGFSHMEWFRLNDGRIAISEVGARPPGAQFSSLLSYAHDIDFYSAWPRLMIFDQFEPPPRRYSVGAAYIRGQGAGRVSKIYGLPEAQQKYGNLVVEAKLPREGQPPSDSYEGDGYIIVRHEDTAVVDSAIRDIVKTIRVELA